MLPTDENGWVFSDDLQGPELYPFMIYDNYGREILDDVVAFNLNTGEVRCLQIGKMEAAKLYFVVDEQGDNVVVTKKFKAPLKWEKVTEYEYNLLLGMYLEKVKSTIGQWGSDDNVKLSSPVPYRRFQFAKEIEESV